MSRQLMFLLALAAVTAAAHAAVPLAQTAPLQARARSVELDQKTGATRYRGNVQIALGRLNVSADYVEIIPRQGQVSEVRARGNPLVMRREAEGEEPEIEIQAQRLEARMATQQIELFEDVSLRQGRDTVRAQTVRYHIGTRHFEALGDPGRNQRVLAVYHPARPLDTRP